MPPERTALHTTSANGQRQHPEMNVYAVSALVFLTFLSPVNSGAPNLSPVDTRAGLLWGTLCAMGGWAAPWTCALSAGRSECLLLEL